MQTASLWASAYVDQGGRKGLEAHYYFEGFVKQWKSLGVSLPDQVEGVDSALFEAWSKESGSSILALQEIGKWRRALKFGREQRGSYQVFFDDLAQGLYYQKAGVKPSEFEWWGCADGWRQTGLSRETVARLEHAWGRPPVAAELQPLREFVNKHDWIISQQHFGYFLGASLSVDEFAELRDVLDVQRFSGPSLLLICRTRTGGESCFGYRELVMAHSAVTPHYVVAWAREGT